MQVGETQLEPWIPVFYEQQGFGIAEWINLASGFGGALVGAGIGALVSWVLQSQANAATLQRDIDARNANSEANLFKSLMRITYVEADAKATVMLFEEAENRAKGYELEEIPLSAKITFISGVGDAQPIQAEEIAPLAAMQKRRLVADYCEALMQHRVMLGNIDEFNERQRHLFQTVDIRLTPHGTAQINLADLEKHRAKYVQATQLAEHVVSDARAISVKAAEIRASLREAALSAHPNFPTA